MLSRHAESLLELVNFVFFLFDDLFKTFFDLLVTFEFEYDEFLILIELFIKVLV